MSASKVIPSLGTGAGLLASSTEILSFS